MLDLVGHKLIETRQVFQGTTYGDNLALYHDTLRFMVTKSRWKSRIKEDYYKYWVLSEKKLYKGDPDLKEYQKRPNGNYHKLYCLNRNLN